MPDTSQFSRSYRILLHDIPFFAYHGIYPLEHERGTQFRIDLELDLLPDLEAFQNDLIASAVNYEDLLKQVLDIATGSRYDLIERLAELIAQRMLEDARVITVLVRVRKNVSALLAPLTWVSVERRLSRLKT